MLPVFIVFAGEAHGAVGAADARRAFEDGDMALRYATDLLTTEDWVDILIVGASLDLRSVSLQRGQPLPKHLNA